jgi:hypothetical protein
LQHIATKPQKPKSQAKATKAKKPKATKAKKPKPTTAVPDWKQNRQNQPLFPDTHQFVFKRKFHLLKTLESH